MDIFGRLDSRVLQHLSFGRRLQKVRIDRKGRVATLVLGDGDLVRLGEGQELLAAGEIPFAPRGAAADIGLQRTEQRRGGKESVRTCRSGWSPEHERKKQQTHEVREQGATAE